MKSYFLLFISSVLLFVSGCGFHLVTSDPVVEDIKLCQTLDGKENEPSCGLTGLDPKGAIFSLQMNAVKAPYGTRIMTRWFHKGEKRELIREMVSEMDDPGAVVHNVRRPRAGWWQEGNYEVEIYINGRASGVKSFTVAALPKQVEPSGGKKPASTMKSDDLDDDDLLKNSMKNPTADATPAETPAQAGDATSVTAPPQMDAQDMDAMPAAMKKKDILDEDF